MKKIRYLNGFNFTTTFLLLAASSFVFADSKSSESDKVYVALTAQGDPSSTSPRCLQDSDAELVWELKTDDDDVHDKDKTFRWGGKGAESVGTIFFDDWNVLVKAANKKELCGFTDWRLPTIDELKKLYALLQKPEAKDYFSLTLASPYWSVSAYEKYPEHAQTVHFGNGVTHYYNGYRGNPLPVHLVRGGEE